ncbi:OmpP1/FadL family transporter [Desulfosudis oleivorans]|uniref:OmpP1/FadL family transporter n=1 Tax=Desulfosudis oleivorans TaxID=181663 RepID=UPI001427B586|nr:outer membrane protein transport protein [Desulfosudis oleivorans]
MTTPAGATHFGDTFGFSPEGMALGNAMTAKVDDWSAVYYNIAGLGRSQHLVNGKSQLFLGYINNAPDLDIEIVRREAATGDRLATNGDRDLDTGTIVIGGVLDIGTLVHLPEMVSSTRLGLAIGLNDDQSVVKINDLDPRTHNFMRYGRECQRMLITTGMGFGFLHDTFGVGLGVTSFFTGEGTALLERVELQTESQSPPGQAKMDLKMEQALVMGAYFSPGKLWRSLDTLELGVAYRAESQLDITPFRAIASTDLGGIPLNIKMALVDYYQPEMYSVGLAYSLNRLTLSADLEFQQWSGFEFSTPMQENYGGELKEFDDIFVPKLGLAYDFNPSLDLLFGYYYEPSFVPDEAVSGRMNFLDNDKHVVSLGCVYQLPKLSMVKGNSEFSIGYQYQHLMDRDVIKTAPTPENPHYSYGGSCHSLMLGVSINI